MSSGRVEIRPATLDDVPAIMAIYNHEVLTSVATFDMAPLAPDEQREWFAAHAAERHPLLVAIVDGRVVGWASLSAWSSRCAYARAAEDSVYVHQDHRGQGVGRALLAELIESARAEGLGVLLARIEASGTASLRIHAAAGFVQVGTMHRVGEKFGRLLDVVLLELQLDVPRAGAG
jgi:phosphinothricin acetyltransferase